MNKQTLLSLSLALALSLSIYIYLYIYIYIYVYIYIYNIYIYIYIYICALTWRPSSHSHYWARVSSHCYLFTGGSSSFLLEIYCWNQDGRGSALFSSRRLRRLRYAVGRLIADRLHPRPSRLPSKEYSREGRRQRTTGVGDKS